MLRLVLSGESMVQNMKAHDLIIMDFRKMLKERISNLGISLLRLGIGGLVKMMKIICRLERRLWFRRFIDLMGQYIMDLGWITESKEKSS